MLLGPPAVPFLCFTSVYAIGAEHCFLALEEGAFWASVAVMFLAASVARCLAMQAAAAAHAVRVPRVETIIEIFVHVCCVRPHVSLRCRAAHVTAVRLSDCARMQ